MSNSHDGKNGYPSKITWPAPVPSTPRSSGSPTLTREDLRKIDGFMCDVVGAILPAPRPPRTQAEHNLAQLADAAGSFIRKCIDKALEQDSGCSDATRSESSSSHVAFVPRKKSP